ncbi:MULTISPECIES: Ig-like domain-containing protein [unclassified Nocardioides]|uniref:Ig-like domain-containing protein n=1 Tax=unclassified Nocardioides TaxID=2615069 RepID=UPI0036187E13
MSARGIRTLPAAVIGVVAGMSLAVLPPVPASALPAAADDSAACTVNGTPGPDRLRGGPGRDVICGWGGDDVLEGAGGNDVIRGGRGDDVLRGGPGDDLLRGGRGDDRLFGDGGDDELRGYVGADRLSGGNGDDDLHGYRGDDRLAGGRGTDTLRGGETERRNHAPTGLRLSPALVAENQPAGTEVGRLAAVDPDAADTHAFALVDGAGADNAAFTVAGDRLLTARAFDFEATQRLSVRVRATDSGGLAATSVLVVEVGDVAEDRSPTAVDDTVTVAEDAPATRIAVRANDTDADGGPMRIATTTRPGHGVVVVATDGTDLTYEPAADYCGPDTFAYTLNGGSTATVSVTVSCTDDGSVVRDDSATIAEDASATAIDVLANDSDADGEALAIDAVVQPGHGTVVITGGGTALTYAPATDYCGSDTFTYAVADASTATVSVTVTCVDDAPVAVDDTLGLTEDDPATAAGVRANDTDVDAGPMAVVSATPADHGEVVVTDAGGVTYEPDADYCGADDFTYTLNGGSTAGVAVEVACVDDAPAGVADSLEVAEDSAWTRVDVLSNDTDVDGGPMASTGAAGASHGQIDFLAGDISYRPVANYCGPDSFTYTLWPGNTSVTVDVTVTCVDDAPTARDDDVTTTADVATDLDLLANDTDVDGGPRAAELVSAPENGTLVLNADGTGTYTPDAGYCNTRTATPDAFTYRLVPGGSTATVRVTVTCVDEAPTAVGDSATVAEDAPATVIAVRANDTDPDGGPMAVASATQPAHGAVVVAADGANVTYRPAADHCGADTFTYTLTPGDSTATVEVTVTCVDDAPIAIDDTVTVSEDAAATAVDVLANDTDIDAGPKEVDSIVTPPAHGTAVVTGGTGLTYTPAPDYCGSDEFTYRLNGGDTATVAVTVTCVNDAPVVATTTLSGTRAAIGNTSLVVDAPTAAYGAVDGPAKVVTADLLATVTDVDGPAPFAITPATITTADGGTVDLRADGSFLYEPRGAAACDGSDSFQYAVSDGASPMPATATGTVQIAVTDCVWYVDNTAPAGGDGTSDGPFDTLAEAEAASGADDFVFVYAGDDTTAGLDTGYDLAAGERLLGQAAGLTVGGVDLVAPEAGKRPWLTATGESVIALNASNVVRGLRVDPAGAGGVTGGARATGGGTLADLEIIDTGVAGTAPGLYLNNTAGTFTVSDLTVDTSAATSPPADANGVRLVNAGTVTFADAGTVQITTKGAPALYALQVNMGAGSHFDAISVTGSTTGAVQMGAVTGSTTFGALDLNTSGGPTAAFAVSNSGFVRIRPEATANVHAYGGPAVDVTGTSGAQLNFDRVRSNDSATDGVNLAGLGGGVFSATDPTSWLLRAAGTTFDLDGGSGEVTFAGTLAEATGPIADITGRTGGAVTLSGDLVDKDPNVGGGINLSGNTGGSTTFSAARKEIYTGTQPAVTMTASAGHALSFTGGGLDIDTTSGAGLRATGSQSVAVTGEVNTIDTTTGTALDVSGTTIAAAGLTFQRISSVGAPVGIRLDNTGTTAAAGSLTVTGTGGTCTDGNRSGCSGGTIANGVGANDSTATPAGTGIVLNQTRQPSLTRMWLHDHANYAIRGTGVVGFTMVDSVINGVNGDNAAGPYFDSAISFTGLTGSAAIRRAYVGGGFSDNVRIGNSSGSLDRLVVDEVTFGVAGSAPANDALLVSTTGSAVLNVTVEDSTFLSAGGDLLQLDHNGTGAGDVVVARNAFSNAHPAISDGGGGVSLSQGGASGTTTLSVTGNSFRDAVGNAVAVVKGAGPTVQVGTFANNTVGLSGGYRSGSAVGDGLKIQSLGQGTSTWAVRNNQIRQYGATGIEVVAGGGTAAAGAVNATIADNTIAEHDAGNPAAYGIHVNLGTTTGDAYAGCAAITGNTVSAGGAATDVRLRQRYATTLTLPGYAGASSDATAAASFVNAGNLGGNVVQVDISGAPGGGVVGGAPCAQPPA